MVLPRSMSRETVQRVLLEVKVLAAVPDDDLLLVGVELEVAAPGLGDAVLGPDL